jgi:CheY-like chemotaxis protein
VREPGAPADPPDPTSDLEHDLNNSLAAILGFGQVIRRDLSLPADLRHSADLLVAEATRTQRMVRQLLEIARRRPLEVDPVDLPAPADGSPELDPASARPFATRPSVLVLDDEPTFRVFLEMALGALGYEPVIAARGAETVELAKSGDPAIILCDHQMAGMSGIDVYEAVVAIRPDLAKRFVMMSGDVVQPALESFAATHEMTRLAKPFDLDTLDRTLRSVMGGGTAQPRG